MKTIWQHNARRRWAVVLLFLAGLVPLPGLETGDWLFAPASWKEEDFQNRFLGRYGVDGYTEPQMDVENYNVYEGVLAVIEDKEAAVTYLRQGVASLESSQIGASAALHFLLGSLLYELGQKEACVEEYLIAIRKHPSFLRAYANLGFTYMELDQPDLALPVLLKAVELGAGESQIYGLIGHIYQSRNLFSGGLTAFQWALVFNPRNNVWREGILRCLIGLERYEEAVGVAREVLAFDRSNGDAWINLANLYLRVERPADAIIHLQTAHALGRASFFSRSALARLFFNRGIYPEARAEAEAAVRLVGEADEIGECLGFAFNLSQAERHEEAMALLATVRARAAELEVVPDPILAGLIEAGEQMARGDLAAARDSLTRLAEIDPGHGEIQLLLGRIHLDLNQPAEALLALQIAETVPATAYPALYEQSRLELRNGSVANALSLLRRARALRPGPEIDQYIRELEDLLP